jgi:hypothetical protein
MFHASLNWPLRRAKAARTVDFSTLVSGVGLMKGLPDAFKKRRERLMIRAWSRS